MIPHIGSLSTTRTLILLRLWHYINHVLTYLLTYIPQRRVWTLRAPTINLLTYLHWVELFRPFPAEPMSIDFCWQHYLFWAAVWSTNSEGFQCLYRVWHHLYFFYHFVQQRTREFFYVLQEDGNWVSESRWCWSNSLVIPHIGSLLTPFQI